MKFDISVFFESLPRNFKFHENLARIIATLRENLRTFMIISRLIFLRMRNTLDKIYTENQNTLFLFNNICFFFSKIVPFMRKCGKIMYSRTGHR